MSFAFATNFFAASAYRRAVHQMRVVLQHRPAAGRVDDDGVHVLPASGPVKPKAAQILRGKIAGRLFHRSVIVQRAAALCVRGIQTSQPFFCSTRAVASCVSG